MSNNPTSKKLTFIELITKHEIKIPIIQRDFAQGREGKEELRKNFLSSLLEAVKSKPLELDFVYGDVIDNVFKPLDGQQRLTTLFLLHWFIAIKENKLDYQLKDYLAKFTYETRISSREFCNDLINRGVIYDSEQKISELIIDSSWFFLSWKQDLTIKSMLTMLDDIQQTFQNEMDIFDKLNNISFHYIELQNFGLSDDLYIKMNARGKALTDFENFKAKFEQYIKKEDWEADINVIETFSHQVDNLWTDLFWNYRDDEKVFDKQILNFFRTFAIINYTLKADIKSTDFRKNIDLLRDTNKTLSFNQYLNLGCINEEYFNSLKSVLNKISDKRGLKTFLNSNNYSDEKAIFIGAINNNLGYAELLKLFAYYQYLAIENDIDVANLQSWMRIVRNLVEAHRLYYDNANTYAESLLFLSKLMTHRHNIIEHFKDTVNQEDKGFPKFIIEEEKIKAELILQNDDWKNAIVEIENHEYFNGQIGFILNWCKDENGIYNIDKFLEYSEKAKAVYSNEGLKNFDNFLFERALLATGDYLLKIRKNYSFLISKGKDERDISWKRLLRDDNDKRQVLKLLFDKINPTTLEQDLKKIVSDFTDENDWRYYFVKFPEMIEVCSQKFIRWDDSFKILLLKEAQTNGNHKEYFSYSLYVELKEKYFITDIIYKDQKSAENVKYFEYKGKQIAFDCNSKKYVLTINNQWDSKEEFDSREEIIEKLIKM